ncbi:hypothetical protein [Paenibacillus wynnii]|uniref:Uncharacterized protein n=1 Tax=Paenibacillus wynnii TaxID=268407 RepID=A0A098MDF1_9BACL|nr:hypothetical protein [Paenibacillus wynnii]KGE18465.1 hypothetical protein PWYN_03080 [Paenibacillus wynnii]KGE20600.1 hypothetical protein PWYN_15540 [Paenibacillus wynnii]
MRPIEAIKDAGSIVLQKFHEITERRCEKCPAFWENVDYWGEYDAGCTLNRDHLEFCPLSLLPRAVMKPIVLHKEKVDALYWEKLYEADRAKWEKGENSGEDTPV